MDPLATSPVVATVALTGMAVLFAAAAWAVLAPAMPAVDIPEAVLHGHIQNGWVHLDHHGGDPVRDADVRTTVDGIARDHRLAELRAGRIANLTRPAGPDWPVHLRVEVAGTTIHSQLLRGGEARRRGPDLVPRTWLEGDAWHVEVRNRGPSPTPEGRQVLVYFYVDGQDPSQDFGWASNRNHTPAPMPSGASYVRTRIIDPAGLDEGPHRFEVVVNINRAGDPNVAELDYGNNRDALRR